MATTASTGRVDDTMNLGGIKVSSAEIEGVLNSVNGIQEVAAIAVPPPDGGPSQLVIYAVLLPGADTGSLHALPYNRRSGGISIRCLGFTMSSSSMPYLEPPPTKSCAVFCVLNNPLKGTVHVTKRNRVFKKKLGFFA